MRIIVSEIFSVQHSKMLKPMRELLKRKKYVHMHNAYIDLLPSRKLKKTNTLYDTPCFIMFV